MKSLHKLHKEAHDLLAPLGQAVLLDHWEELTKPQKERFFNQILSLDIPLFHRQREALTNPQSHPHASTPFQKIDRIENGEDQVRGLSLMKEGKCGVIVLAGGQGSRLRCKGPKGSVEVSLVKKKSLFQLIAEKVLAASECVGYPLPLAIMTSPATAVEIETLFIQHAFFGLKPTQVSFFIQEIAPLLDEEGDLFLETPNKIAYGPNGNGGVFRRFYAAGLLEKWRLRGVEMVQVIPVDNPLALPFDPKLLGYHARMSNEVTIKTALKRDSNEKVGVLGEVDGRPQIIEYSEIGEHADAYTHANLGLFAFSMDFIKKVSVEPLPLHPAKKAVHFLSREGKTELSETPNAWKFEEFIFDVLPLAMRCSALEYERGACFAPLKNLHGEDSLSEVRDAILGLEREIYQSISGRAPPLGAQFELGAKFYYPTETFRKKWEGKALPETEYIE